MMARRGAPTPVRWECQGASSSSEICSSTTPSRAIERRIRRDGRVRSEVAPKLSMLSRLAGNARYRRGSEAVIQDFTACIWRSYRVTARGEGRLDEVVRLVLPTESTRPEKGGGRSLSEKAERCRRRRSAGRVSDDDRSTRHRRRCGPGIASARKVRPQELAFQCGAGARSLRGERTGEVRLRVV